MLCFGNEHILCMVFQVKNIAPNTKYIKQVKKLLENNDKIKRP